MQTQGEIPALTIAMMPGNEPGTTAADNITAAAIASKYTVPDEETFILRATAGLYPGEISKVFEGHDLATNPIGMVSDLHNPSFPAQPGIPIYRWLGPVPSQILCAHRIAHKC